MDSRLRAIAATCQQEAEQLTSELIRIPSFSGDEKAIADFTAAKLTELDFDEVTIDWAGNVIGRMAGRGGGKSLNFNCHLDTVGVSEDEAWPYPPFSGTITDSAVFGRGASDTKGAFAAQIVAVAALKRAGLLPAGDLYVTGSVGEEDTGGGSNVLSGHLQTDYVVIGEATENDIAVRHRGSLKLDLRIKGRAGHSSQPHLAVNPHFCLAEVVRGLSSLPLSEDPEFGRTTCVPTLIRTSLKDCNIIPEELVLTLDCRTVPADTPERVVAMIEDLAARSRFEGIQTRLDDDRRRTTIRFYTGRELDTVMETAPFRIDPGHDLVRSAQGILSNAFQRDVPVKGWNFSTDSPYFARRGMAVIGFAPAEIKYVHTCQDQVSRAMLAEGLLGNMALAVGVGNA